MSEKESNAPDAGGKRPKQPVWGGHKGGWDKETGTCASCFEEAFQGALWTPGADNDDGSLEDPNLSGKGYQVNGASLGPNQIRRPVIRICPQCGESIKSFRPTKTGTQVECHNGHNYKSDLEVVEIVEGWE